MDQRYLFSIAALIIYLFLFLYYLRMEAFTLLLIANKGLVTFFRSKKQKRTAKSQKSSSKSKKGLIKKLFEESLFFNHSLAIISMVILISIIAILPITEKYKLELVTIVTSTVPYVWSYFRATNVGINGGIIGAQIGLLIFAISMGDFSWLVYHAPHFLLYSFLANTSGWLGGWVGAGQIDEAVFATISRFELGADGSNIQGLTEIFQENINSLLKKDFHENFKYIDKKPSLSVLDSDLGTSLISYRHEMEWQLIEKPQQTAIKWLFKKDIPSTNIIIDHMFNLFRSKVTKIIFLSKADLQNPAEKQSSEKSTIHVVILNYKETPSIVWIDQEIEILAKKIADLIKTSFRHQGKGNKSAQFSLEDIYQFAYRNWPAKITLEQYSKETYGSEYPYEAIRENRLKSTKKVPAIIMDEVREAPSFFDKFRGSLLTFIAFLFAQVMVAIIVNIASEGLAAGLW